MRVYARDFASWVGCSITQAHCRRSGELLSAWFLRPEGDENKVKEIRELLAKREPESMIDYMVLAG